MNFENIKSVIERVFDNNEDVNPGTSGEVRDAIEPALNSLDRGELRVAEPLGNSQWQVNQWLKKAVLLSFKLNDMDVISCKTFCLYCSECGFDAFFCKYRCICRFWKYD